VSASTEPQLGTLTSVIGTDGSVDTLRAALSSIEPQSASREYRYLLTALTPDVTSLVFGMDENGNGEVVLASADGPSLRQAGIEPLADQALLSALDGVRASLQEEGRYAAGAVLAAAAVAMGLSVGYVIWLLRGGVLLSSFLSSLPAWRLVDPLPILGHLDDDDDDNDGSADDSLEYMVARNNSELSRRLPDETRSNTSASESS
jgi:hypothetical protein